MPQKSGNAAQYIIAGTQTAGNIAGGLFGQKRQYKYNRRLAAQQHERNMELLKYQLDYDLPANQMQRFKDAGLNPNLIYGQGDAGSQGQPLRYPDIQPPDMQTAAANVGGDMMDKLFKLQQMKLMQSQTGLTDVKTEESGVKQQLMRAQRALVDANPYLNETYMESLVGGFKAMMDVKRSGSEFLLQEHIGSVNPNSPHLWQKMHTELDLLEQRFRLGEADQKVKAEIIQGKEFSNALQEIQVKWMTDGTITSQHVYLFLMMLLQKMVSK